MNSYLELREKHQKAINDFPIGFTFNDSQFKEVLAKLSVKDPSELISIGNGGFIRHSDYKEFSEMLKNFDTEEAKAREDPAFCYEMFLYELGNHEYCITYDLEDTLYACGLTLEQVQSNSILSKALIKARKDYLASVE